MAILDGFHAGEPFRQKMKRFDTIYATFKKFGPKMQLEQRFGIICTDFFNFF